MLSHEAFTSSLFRALALKNVNIILFYHSKTLLYQYTIPFYNSSTLKNSIFIKILFFNPFFIISFHPTVQPHFPGLFNSQFLFLPPNTGSTHNTHPLYTDQPIQAHHHTHTHKHIHQPSNKATHKHNPATKPSHTHKHKPIQKPGHRSKPRPGHRSTPSINQSTPSINQSTPPI